MSPLVEQVSKQWRYTRVENAWFPCLRDLVAGLTVEQATWRSPQGGHTMWELLYHLRYSTERMAARLRGEATDWDQPSSFGESAESAATAEAWQALIDSCEAARLAYLSALSELHPDELAVPREGDWGTFTFADYALQLTLHDAYHIGQIALLRSLQGLPPLL